jgi:hypothetical protein
MVAEKFPRGEFLFDAYDKHKLWLTSRLLAV